MTPARARILAAALVLLAALALLYRLGAAPIDRSSERRCHRVAEAMLASGDYVVPRLDGEVRLQKPPLYYWLASASAGLCGGPSPSTTRLPSALAALALLALTMAWARSIGGPAHALLAGAALIAMMQFHSSGRRGDAEMTLALASTAALWTGRRLLDAPSRGRSVAFAACLALAFLAKATAAFVTVLLPLLAFAAAEGQLRRLRERRFLLAVLVAAAAGFAWYGAIVARVPGALDSLLGDAVLPVGIDAHGDGATHYRPPWYFASKLFGIAFPAILLLPLALRDWIRTRLFRGDPQRRFVAVAFLAAFAAFSLIPQKQKHYLLPALPALALLLADATIAFASAPARGLRFPARATAGLLAAAGCAAAAVLVFFFRTLAPDAAGAGLALTELAAVSFACALAATVRARAAVFAIPFVAGIALLVAVESGHVDVFRGRIEEAAEGGPPLPDQEQLLDAASHHPRLLEVLGVESNVAKLRSRP